MGEAVATIETLIQGVTVALGLEAPHPPLLGARSGEAPAIGADQTVCQRASPMEVAGQNGEVVEADHAEPLLTVHVALALMVGEVVAAVVFDS